MRFNWRCPAHSNSTSQALPTQRAVRSFGGKMKCWVTGAEVLLVLLAGVPGVTAMKGHTGWDPNMGTGRGSYIGGDTYQKGPDGHWNHAL